MTTQRKRLGIITALGMCVAAAVVCLSWPAGLSPEVRRHLSAMDDALKQMEIEPDSPEHMKTYEKHRIELLRIGHLKQKVFDITVSRNSAESKALSDAVEKQANSRPVCTWTPKAEGVRLTVFATEDEMTEWNSLLSRWTNSDTNP